MFLFVKKSYLMKKINVRHILIESKSSKEIEFEDANGNKAPHKTLYRLYVKITYNRKTTQFKSMITASYSSMEDFISIHNKMMESELKLVRFVMEKRISAKGEDTDPKGIGAVISEYDKDLINVIQDNVVDNITKAVLSSSSEFSNLVIFHREGNCILTVLKAYIILLNKPESLVRLIPEVELLDKITKFLERRKDSKKSIHLLDWLYGDMKENIKKEMKINGVPESDIDQVIKQVNIELRSKGLL